MVKVKDSEEEIAKLNLLIKEASKKAIELKEQAMHNHFEKINQIIMASYTHHKANGSR